MPCRVMVPTDVAPLTLSPQISSAVSLAGPASQTLQQQPPLGQSYISSDQLHDTHTPATTLFLDVRSRGCYETSRLVDSLHVALPPLLMRRLKRRGNVCLESALTTDGDKEYFRRRIQTARAVVVVSSDSGQEEEDVGKHLANKLTKDGYNVHLFKGVCVCLHIVFFIRLL